MSEVFYFDHPLIKHKLTLMRMKETGTREFRKLVEEASMLMGYEVLSDIKTSDVTISTPLEETVQPMINGRKLVVVPILRAGLGMVGGILSLVPNAKVGHIGICRDEKTHAPQLYFCKLPGFLEERTIIVVDPMLATGGSLNYAVDELKSRGGRDIRCICMIASPEGVKAFTERHPDVRLYVGALDRCLNSDSYICPGLGDAGDRIFGTT